MYLPAREIFFLTNILAGPECTSSFNMVKRKLEDSQSAEYASLSSSFNVANRKLEDLQSSIKHLRQEIRENFTIPSNIYALSHELSTPVAGLRCLTDEEIRHARAYLERDPYPIELRYDAFDQIARQTNSRKMLSVLTATLEKGSQDRQGRRDKIIDDIFSNSPTLREDRNRLDKLSSSSIYNLDESFQCSFFVDGFIERMNSKDSFVTEIFNTILQNEKQIDRLTSTTSDEKLFPNDAALLASFLTGYVTNVDELELERCARELGAKIFDCRDLNESNFVFRLEGYLQQVVSLLSKFLSHFTAVSVCKNNGTELCRDLLQFDFEDDASLYDMRGHIFEWTIRNVLNRLSIDQINPLVIENVRQTTLKVCQDWRHYSIMQHVLLVRLSENGPGIYNFEKEVPIKPEWYSIDRTIHLPRDCIFLQVNDNNIIQSFGESSLKICRDMLAVLSDENGAENVESLVDIKKLRNVTHAIFSFLDYTILLRKNGGRNIRYTPQIKRQEKRLTVDKMRDDNKYEDKMMTDYRNFVNSQMEIKGNEITIENEADIQREIRIKTEEERALTKELAEKREPYYDALFIYYDPYLEKLHSSQRERERREWSEYIFKNLGEKWHGFGVVKMFELLKFMKLEKSRSMVKKILNDLPYEYGKGWRRIKDVAAAHLSLNINEGRKELTKVLIDCDNNPIGTIVYFIALICTETFESLFPKRKHDEYLTMIKEFLFKKITKCCCAVNCVCSEKKVVEPIRILERLYRYEMRENEKISSAEMITFMLLFQYGSEIYSQLLIYVNDVRVCIDKNFIYPHFICEEPIDNSYYSYKQISNQDDMAGWMLSSLIINAINHMNNKYENDWHKLTDVRITHYDKTFYLEMTTDYIQQKYQVLQIFVMCYILRIKPDVLDITRDYMAPVKTKGQVPSSRKIGLIQDHVYSFDDISHFMRTAPQILRRMTENANISLFGPTEKEIWIKKLIVQRKLEFVEFTENFAERYVAENDVDEFDRLVGQCIKEEIFSKCKQFVKFLEK